MVHWEQLLLYSLIAAGRKDLLYRSFRHLGCNSLSLKELLNEVTVSYRGWEAFCSNDDSFATILLSPTSYTVSRGIPRTELAFLISLSSLFLSAVEMLLPQQTTP